MKFADICTAEYLAKQHTDLLSSRKVAESLEGLGVTIRGRYQDNEMLVAVQQAVLGEFDRRIADVRRELEALGVEMD